MYFERKIASSFAALEQNQRNYRVANAIDCLLMVEAKKMKDPLYVAELGGGAHPDRYHKLFERLLKKPNGQIDWVDISPIMLQLARKYVDTKEYRRRLNVIKFVEKDILFYLSDLPDNKIDLGIMKYTIDCIKDLESLIRLMSLKLKHKGVFVSTLTQINPDLRSISTNARFFYKGKEFPVNETRRLKDGESFEIKFFNVSGNPHSGYMTGAETIKFYHSSARFKALAKKYKLKMSLGDWKKIVPRKLWFEGLEDVNQDVLVLRKK